MAQIENPRKDFQFSVSIPGMNPFLAQKVHDPEYEVEKVSHGDTNFDVHTAGRIKVGEISMEKILVADTGDTWIDDWMNKCMDAYVGGGDIPQNYKKTLEIIEYAVDGSTILNIRSFEGCWPTKKAATEWNRRGNANTMHSLSFSVDRRKVN